MSKTSTDSTNSVPAHFRVVRCSGCGRKKLGEIIHGAFHQRKGRYELIVTKPPAVITIRCRAPNCHAVTTITLK